MVMRLIHSLTEQDMYEFLALFKSSHIKTITLDLSSTYQNRSRELATGSTILYDNLTLQTYSIDRLKKDLEEIEYSQVNKCGVYLSDGDNATHIYLNLVDHKIEFHSYPNMIPIEKIVAFAEKKKLEKLTIGFA